MLGGNYVEALRLFGEQEEMRKSLWKPRFTPVTFSLLLTATADEGPDAAKRIRHLPALLRQMGAHGVLPRAETCERLIGACLDAKELEIAQTVVQVAAGAGHELDPTLIEAVENGGRVAGGESEEGEEGDQAAARRRIREG